ncbi:MAG: 2-oxoglutarate and iron-dependent oxygenase domain-containing protein [Thermostichus sp. HHBFW_bins_43]
MSSPISVPSVDLAPFFSGDPQARQAVATEIATACQTIGFFYVRNHDLPQALTHEG